MLQICAITTALMLLGAMAESPRQHAEKEVGIHFPDFAYGSREDAGDGALVNS